MINWFKKKDKKETAVEQELVAYGRNTDTPVNAFPVLQEKQSGGCCGGETVQLQTVKKAITNVTKNMVIADVIQSHPQAIEIMMKNGLHCFGCGGNMYESIEQGATGHGMTSSQVNKIVNDINASLKKKSNNITKKERPLRAVTKHGSAKKRIR